MQDGDLGWAEAIESGDSIADAVYAAFRRRVAHWQHFGLAMATNPAPKPGRLTNAEADERSIDCSLRSHYLIRSQLS
jgi:hypothetical protein